MYDLVIIGAGAAGLMAAISSAQAGRKTVLVEKNKQAGVKILMSGGTRCNITHATDKAGIAAAFASFDKKQAQFLRSALAALPPEHVIEMLETAGVATKTESTGKIFPVSNRAIDVRNALVHLARDAGADMVMNFAVNRIEKTSQGFTVHSTTDCVHGHQLLITTGGKSYPGCGTTGDGYLWAHQFGHHIVDPVPALTPLTTNEDWIRNLKGITIDDATLSIVRHDTNRRPGDYGTRQFLDSRRSSVLLTHFGFSGPAALDISRVITRDSNRKNLSVVCDFLPEYGPEELLAALTSVCRTSGARSIGKLLPQYVPRRLAEAILNQLAIPQDHRSAELSKKQIHQLTWELKGSIVPLSGTLGFKKAEVTAGGVQLKEIDSKTMQSKLVDDLFFAGEVLDIDGPIGGFNFQAAFSTGWLAGWA